MGKVFIGVDGGSTKTLMVCLDESKKVLGRFFSGCTNKNSVGDDLAKLHLKEGIFGVLGAAARAPNDVAGITLSISGVDRPHDKELVSSWVNEFLPAVPLSIHNDAVAALASGTEGVLYGIVAISGTGMITYGYNSKGEFTRAGGWGPMLGEVGSGYSMGFNVLKAICTAKDEITPSTQLTQKVLEVLQIQKEEDLISWVYAKHDEGWQRIAKLSKEALECAKAGDEVAIQILEDAASSIVVAAKAVEKRLNLTEPYPFVMAGGNIDRDGSLLTEILVKQIAVRLPLARPIRPKVEPAIGAALLSFVMHGTK